MKETMVLLLESETSNQASLTTRSNQAGERESEPSASQNVEHQKLADLLQSTCLETFSEANHAATQESTGELSFRYMDELTEEELDMMAKSRKEYTQFAD
jgi:hypothetical protein